MLHEYAIDPELAGDTDSLKKLSLLFDGANPRRISRFPEEWAQQVIAYTKTHHLKSLKETEIIIDHLIKVKCIRSFERIFDNANDWVKNTISQHKLAPFNAIICDKAGGFIPSNDIHAANPQLSAPSSWLLTKDLANLEQLLLPLFLKAKDIRVIDQFFDPHKSDFQKIFKQCFKAIHNRADSAKVTIGICASNDKDRQPYSAGQELKFKADILQKIVPSGCKAQLITALKSEMHPRYIITDIASFIMDHSFDVNPTAAANITMISATKADVIKKQYFPGP